MGGPARRAVLNLAPGVKRAELEAAMKEQILATGTLMGTYERKEA